MLSRVGNPTLAKKAMDTVQESLVRTNLFALSVVLLLLVAWFKRSDTRYKNLVALGFVLLGAYDLISIDRFYYKRALFKPASFYRPDEAIQFIKKQEGSYRVASSLKIMHSEHMVPLALLANQGTYVTHLFPYFKIESLESIPRARVSLDYNSFFETHLSEFPPASSAAEVVHKLLAGQIDFWRLCNVRYVMTDGFLYGLSKAPVPVFQEFQKHPDLTLVATGSGVGGRKIAIFEVRDPLPRLALIPEEASHVLESEILEPKLLEEGYMHLRAAIDVSASSALVWNSRLDRNWKVQLDGERVHPFAVEGILTGISIPPGAHDLILEFDPDTRLMSLSRITLGTSILLAGACVSVSRVRKKRVGRKSVSI